MDEIQYSVESGRDRTLEQRIAVLEAFHHWIATQIVPSFQERFRHLEAYHPFDRTLFTETEKISRQLPDDGTLMSEPQRIQAGVDHLENHPPFTTGPCDQSTFERVKSELEPIAAWLQNQLPSINKIMDSLPIESERASGARNESAS